MPDLPTPEMTPVLEAAWLAKLAQETRKEKALADKEEYNATQQKLYLESNQRKTEFDLASAYYHHEYMFFGRVTEDTVDQCLQHLALWDRQDENCDMHIIMDSPGGSLLDGIHLFDQITAYSKRPWDTSDRPKGTHSTKMTIRGYAASMGGILVQSADERVIGPEAYMMIHELSTATVGKLNEIKNEVKFCEMITARIKKIFLARSAGKITEEAFDTGWADGRDWWLDSQQALDRGFVDRIG